MYQQVYDPVGDSLGLTAIFAVLPLITLFVLLGGLKVSAHWAALSALGVAIVVALVVYTMPVGQAFDSALLGAVFGLFPIMWIVWNAIWIYNMTEATGHFAVLRRSFGRISDDQRVQAVIIAFCFGALLEALAGLRHAGRHHRGDADRARLPADQGRRRRARREHRARSRSARSRSRSSRSARSPACPRRTSARWSAARRRCSRCSCR